MTQITIGYFADGLWSHQTLEKLIHDPSIRVAFICARFDMPDPILRESAERYQIKFLTHANINSDDFLEKINAFDCDLFVSMSFNQIFRQRLLDYPKFKTINCHAGKLPFYRGRNILNWALINDEKEFGITVHYMDEGIDTGDILMQRMFPISDKDTYATLLERAYPACADLLYEAIKQVQAGDVVRKKQSEIDALGFYCISRKEGDERLSWMQSSRDIFNFVRALCRPGPEARTYLGDIEVRINQVELLPGAKTYKGVPGSVIGSNSEFFLVKTIDSYVKVVSWTGIDKLRIGSRFT